MNLKTVLGILVTGAVFTGCASPVEKSGLFAQTDLDKDGYVSLNEWKQTGRNDVSFLAADRDHKNKLNETEFFEAVRLNEQSQNNSQAQQRDNDNRVTQNVMSALNASNDVNGSSITVDTLNGTVQLSGFVRTIKEKQRAESITKSVPDVNQVFNSITVKN